MVICRNPRPLTIKSRLPPVVVDAALGVVLLGGDDAHAGSQGKSRRVLRVLRALRPHLPDVLVHQILKRRAIRFEAGGVGVGEIVGDDRHLRVLCVEAGLCRP